MQITPLLCLLPLLDVTILAAPARRKHPIVPISKTRDNDYQAGLCTVKAWKSGDDNDGDDQFRLTIFDNANHQISQEGGLAPLASQLPFSVNASTSPIAPWMPRGVSFDYDDDNDDEKENEDEEEEDEKDDDDDDDVLLYFSYNKQYWNSTSEKHQCNTTDDDKETITCIFSCPAPASLIQDLWATTTKVVWGTVHT